MDLPSLPKSGSIGEQFPPLSLTLFRQSSLVVPRKILSLLSSASVADSTRLLVCASRSPKRFCHSRSLSAKISSWDLGLERVLALGRARPGPSAMTNASGATETYHQTRGSLHNLWGVEVVWN